MSATMHWFGKEEPPQAEIGDYWSKPGDVAIYVLTENGWQVWAAPGVYAG